MPKRHRIMNPLLIFQPPEYKIHSVSRFLYDVPDFLYCLRMPIKFQYRRNIRISFLKIFRFQHLFSLKHRCIE